MVIAIIALSITVLLLLVCLLACIVKAIDAEATARTLSDCLRQTEESRCRMQQLVYEKFGYRAPLSDKYLSLEELKHQEASRQGGDQ